MTPHELGRRLREQVLSDRLVGYGLDPRRLQAVVGDLCSGEHAGLVAPLRYLVLSAPFASAAAQDPPLADARLLQRLAAELAQMYAAPVCQRLQPVLEGLLGMPERSLAPGPVPWSGSAAERPATDVQRTRDAAAPAWADPAAGAAGGRAWGSAAAGGGGPSAPLPASPSPQSAPPRSGSTALNVVLAFLSGVLLMVLGVIGLVLWQRQQNPAVIAAPTPAPTAAPTVAAPVAATPEPARQPQPSATEEPTAETPSTTDAAALDRAVGGIQALYGDLSAKDFSQAQARYGAAVADQFDEGFFRQFERVSVQDLRSTSQTGNTVNLEGLVTFVWPDGATQTETRSFSVDTSHEPPVITASEFGRVVKGR